MGIPPGDADAIQDIIIVGAGPCGINAAYRFQEQFPHLKSTILERRGVIGGTWDLFRFPGVRNDSDFYTVAFQWRPWLSGKVMVDAGSIRDYIVEAAQETGIGKRILFHHEVKRASWSSEQQMWTLSCVVNGATDATFHTRFVFWASGYYNYEQPLPAPISGIENFKGFVAHTQFWPEDLDYAGKNIAVIGSGATAVTIVPALAEKAKKVTMVQRTPSYIIALPRDSPLMLFLCRWLPIWLASAIVRTIYILFTSSFDIYLRHFPNHARGTLKKAAVAQLPPDFPFDLHFVPPYKPLQQRPGFCRDGDFFEVIREGKADIATGVIEACTADGLRLTSGQTIDGIDIIVTATGINLQTAGGARIVVDGKDIVPGDQFAWRGAMIQDVPNAAMGLGYSPFSGTLGSDTAVKLFLRVIKHVQNRGYSSATPRLEAKYAGMKMSPLINTTSTYNKLTGRNMPQFGERGPWAERWNHVVELWKLMFYSDIEGLVFAKL